MHNALGSSLTFFTPMTQKPMLKITISSGKRLKEDLAVTKVLLRGSQANYRQVFLIVIYIYIYMYCGKQLFLCIELHKARLKTKHNTFKEMYNLKKKNASVSLMSLCHSA